LFAITAQAVSRRRSGKNVVVAQEPSGTRNSMSEGGRRTNMSLQALQTVAPFMNVNDTVTRRDMRPGNAENGRYGRTL